MSTFVTTTALEVKMVGTLFDTATVALAEACIDEAENEIKKQLSERYDLTTAYFTEYTSCPPIVRTLATQYSEGLMYEAMSRGSKEGYARADRYLERVMKNLLQIASGEASLFDTAGAVIVADNTKWQVLDNTSGYQTTFNEDNPKNWKVDETKLDDISVSRGGSGDSNEID